MVERILPETTMPPAPLLPGAEAVVPAGSYDVIIGGGTLSRAGEVIQRVAPAHRYALVTDTNVGPLYADILRREFGDRSLVVCTLPAGESYKTRESWAAVTDQLLDNCLGRDSAVIALGGGVVCDLAGFVAATFMRGVPVVHVPTTLLAMIDASIGGKTGVDTPAGKNLVGAFHPPSAVVIDPEVLRTLPVAELQSGLAEAVKHGAIADETYFELLSNSVPSLVAELASGRDSYLLGGIIETSVRIKAGVVSADEREKGARKTLNFGHTVGHAIELLSGFSMRHGEAVAVGMVLETEAGERAGITLPGTAARIADVLDRAGLPIRRPEGPNAERILDAMRGDKKGRTGQIEYAIPARIGKMAAADSGYTVRLPDWLVCEVLA